MDESKLEVDSNNHDNKRILFTVLSGVVILAVIGLAIYLVINNRNTSKEAGSAAQPDSQGNVASSTKNQLYFTHGSTGKYVATNVKTGETKDLLPAGYELVDPHSYPQSPAYLVLQKERQLYAYNVATKEATKIGLEALPANEGDPASPSTSYVARIHPSLSDKTKLYLEMQTIDNTHAFGGGVVAKTTAYFYDFSENKVVPVEDKDIPNAKNSSCYEYDSVHTRFFYWPCGEGIGSSVPLVAYDYSSKTSKEIAGGDQQSNFVEYLANTGEFVVVAYGEIADQTAREISKITRIKTDKDMTKQVYMVGKTVKLNTEESVYSALFIDAKKMIVLGGANQLTLLNYNDSQVTSSIVLPEAGAYANFIFSDGEKLYYKVGTKIKVVDLDTKTVEKSFDVDSDQEVGLMVIPD